ncbi:MAG: 2OG-Fe(II) oxygenase [SAR324 cluster bacterium]|nr:2OG-Fe(II) oxygenase [SAR324 cluster bacterium]
MKEISKIINLERNPINDLKGFARDCKRQLQEKGALMLPGFVLAPELNRLKKEAEGAKVLAFFCEQSHTAYLSAPISEFPDDHPRNRQVHSSKGCITDDQIREDSPLRTIYDSQEFQQFICTVLGESCLFPYADSLSSINIHFYETGQELGWHFDNSSFAITLLIQAPLAGGELEYVRQLRNSAKGEMNFEGVEAVLNGDSETNSLSFEAGTLVLFRGRDTLHRVTPVQGQRERIQAVLAYNTEPAVSLSKEARLTFFGRLE